VTSPEPDDLLAELVRVGEEIGVYQTRLDRLYTIRLFNVQLLRQYGVTYRRIAEAAGTTEEALMQAVRRARTFRKERRAD